MDILEKSNVKFNNWKIIHAANRKDETHNLDWNLLLNSTGITTAQTEPNPCW